MNNADELFYELNIAIVKHGLGSKILSLSKKLGIAGGTIMFGKGTIKNWLLKFLELAENKKEIVIIISDHENGKKLLNRVFLDLKLAKHKHGIAFSVPICSVIGSRYYNTDKIIKNEGDKMCTYNSIIIIVNKGIGNKVVEAANEAGSRGATIINARGSNVYEKNKIFSIEIEPEKEIVLILSEVELTEGICKKIEEKINIDKPGNGMMFVQDVSQAYGMKFGNVNNTESNKV